MFKKPVHDPKIDNGIFLGRNGGKPSSRPGNSEMRTGGGGGGGREGGFFNASANNGKFMKS